jgi:hypothetical protein
MEGRDSRGGACKQEGKREVRGGRRDERLSELESEKKSSRFGESLDRREVGWLGRCVWAVGWAVGFLNYYS